MSVSKVIKPAAAMMSMLSLETAMCARFGADASPETEQIMIMATGGGIVAVMSICTIICSTIEINKLKKITKQQHY